MTRPNQGLSSLAPVGREDETLGTGLICKLISFGGPLHFHFFPSGTEYKSTIVRRSADPVDTDDSVGKTGLREVIKRYVKRYVTSITKGYMESVCQAPNKVCVAGPPGPKGIRGPRGQRGPKGKNGG